MNFETEVALRFDDLDTYGHVNNVRYGTYLEEARIDYLAEALDCSPSTAAEHLRKAEQRVMGRLVNGDGPA